MGNGNLNNDWESKIRGTWTISDSEASNGITITKHHSRSRLLQLTDVVIISYLRIGELKTMINSFLSLINWL